MRKMLNAHCTARVPAGALVAEVNQGRTVATYVQVHPWVVARTKLNTFGHDPDETCWVAPNLHAFLAGSAQAVSPNPSPVAGVEFPCGQVRSNGGVEIGRLAQCAITQARADLVCKYCFQK